jgi:hypothetical protein
MNYKIFLKGMKYKLIFSLFLILMTFTFNSCESLTGCKICRQVTYVDEKIEQEGNESEYCGAELVAIEAASDIVTGNTRVTWECR